MFHLKEIGLRSLTQITRGSVRIEKNPALCFVDTIDWAQITVNAGSKENVFSLNKPGNECPTCPNNNESGKNAIDTPNCPESPETKQRLCWNRQQCQQSKITE